MRRILMAVLLIAGVTLSGRLFAQDAESTPSEPEQSEWSLQKGIDLNLGAQIKSQHLFFGLVSYDSWVMNPDFTFSAYGFFFNAWACVPVSRITEGMEVDLQAGFKYGPFSLSYLDCYYAAYGKKRDYASPFFRFNPADGGSVHQSGIMFTFAGVRKFPIEFTAFLFTFGDYDDGWGNPDGVMGKPLYSLYLGLGYTHTIKTGQTLHYEVGGTPYAGFFSRKGANICNVSFKFTQPVKLSSTYTLPVFGQLVLNPVYEQLYFVLGFNIL